MEYSISKEEILRRKIAYVRLSVSLFIGTVLVSMIPHLTIPVYIYIIIVVSLFLIGIYSFYFFKKLLPIKMVLTETAIERVNNKVIEKYLLSDIYKVEIKYTSNNTIREIYIEFKNGKKMFVTALNGVGEFEKELFKKTNKGIVKKEIHEHIDFDHPMFYILLGLLLGGVIVLLIKVLNELDTKYLIIGLIACVIYMIILSIYLIKTKQVTRRIGEK